jgi:5-formyltetrahydrofolate cyclo-ligase
MTAPMGDTPYTPAQRKSALRRELRRKRSDISPEDAREAALAAACHLAGSAWLRRAQHIAVYLNYGSELGTTALLDILLREGKNVYVPRIGTERRMRFVEIKPTTPLRLNMLGIKEPAGRLRTRRVKQLDVIIVPLLGFDGTGQRLGNGGGYYDRALATPRPFRKPLLVGYGYEIQRTAMIPSERWDIRLNAMATEVGIYKF